MSSELTLTQDQAEFAAVVREFLDDRSPEAQVRRVMESDSGIDESLWQAMAGELGICGLAVPERYGGGGAGFAEIAVVLEELGRSLACVPYLSSVVLAQTLILALGDTAACERWLPALCTGEMRAAVAFAEPGAPWTPDGVALPARRSGAGWHLSGTKTFVGDGASADVLFVVAQAPSGLAVFAVAADAPGLARVPLPTMDQTRPQARVVFADTPAEPVGAQGDAAVAAFATLLAVAAAALAIESAGGAQRTLDMAVEYAKTRVQFGRQIGSFQAIKHKCADMLMRVESARSAAYYARGVVDAAFGSAPGVAWHSARVDHEFSVATSMAKAVCPDAFLACAQDNIQVHGGIGFTWEHSAHLYFKRAKGNQLMFGDSIFHREALARLLAI